MLYNIFSTIFPVFGLILIGLLLKQSRFISEAFFKEANKLAFWVALPCLLFHKIAVAELAIGKASQILIVLFSATTIMVAVSWIASRVMRLKPTSAAAFIHASFRGNLAYIGLPVIIYSLQSDGIPNLPEAEALAVICLAPIVPFYNVVAIMFLQSAGSDKRLSPFTLALESIKNPLLVACVLGFIFSYFKIYIPVPVDRALALVAQAALPMSLMAIGASLSIGDVKKSSGPTSVATFLKIAVAPAVTLLLIRMLKLNPVDARIAIIFMSTPTAVAAYVMTDQMKCDASITGSTVVLSTILSIITFSIAIILT